MELSEEELGLRYQSFCDPRLNFEQSLGTLAFPFIYSFPRANFWKRRYRLLDVQVL